MRKSPNNIQALAAFIDRKSEIDTILARLTALSSEHFNRPPNDASWADVGTLAATWMAFAWSATPPSTKV
jgi:hypothetical protein